MMDFKLNKYKFFMVRVTGGQEEHIARMAELRVRNSNGSIKIKSIFIPPTLKGTIIVEAYSYSDVMKAFENIKHFKKIIPGILSHDDVRTLLGIGREEEVINIGDEVEIIAGPFKGMIAKVINIKGEKSRREAVIQLQDASVSQIPIIISVVNLKKRKPAEKR